MQPLANNRFLRHPTSEDRASRAPSLLPRSALACGIFAGLMASAQAMEPVLEEIVVTAQKRQQDLQSVPIAISSFSGERIAEMGIQRVTDLTSHVPNVDFFSFFSEAQTPSLCFRGVCLSQQFSDSFEAPVAMYTDEVYVGSTFAQSLQLFDVERIEVLKGPQGTLYGRNTTGGLINVIANKPTDTFSASVDVELGSHATSIVEGTLSGPLSDTVRARLAVRSHQADGWVNGVIDGSKANATDTLALRGMLEIDLNDQASLLLTSHYFKVEQGAEANMLNGTLDPVSGEACSAGQLASGSCVGIYSDYMGPGLSAIDIYGSFDADTWYGADIPDGSTPKNDVTNYGLNARLDWAIGALQLTSITAFANSEKDYIEDLDGDLFLFYDDRLYAEADTFSQEFRLSGEAGEIQWLGGLFYYNDDRTVGTSLLPASYYADESDKETTSYAAFANAEIPLTDAGDWRLLLGARYTYEEVELAFNRSGSWTGTVNDERRALDSDSVDWKAVLQWEPTDESMLYLSASTAFRSANINNQFIWGGVDASSPTDSLAPVKPESLTSYELGFKSDFWDGKARLNAATFYYDIEDMQALIFVFTEGSLGVSRLKNIENVAVTGAEVELQVQATERLFLSLGAGVLDSDIDTAASIEIAGQVVALNGRELPFSNPAATLGVNYTIPLGDAGQLSLQADYKWKDDHYFSIKNDATSFGQSYDVVDLRVVWHSADEQYSVEAFANNVFDEKYYVYAGGLTTNTQNIVWGKPSWYGMRLRYQF